MRWACEYMRTAFIRGRPPRATSVITPSMTPPASTALQRSSLPAAPCIALAQTVSVRLLSRSRSVTVQLHSYEDCLAMPNTEIPYWFTKLEHRQANCPAMT